MSATLLDVPRQFHQQTPLIIRRQAEATLSHTDAWTDSRCHHCSICSPSWLKILNHTPQTCFQQPAFRCGQGRRDVRRKKGYLMGIWKWIKFGVPDTSLVLNHPMTNPCFFFFSFLTFHFLPLILLPVFFSFEVLLFDFLCVFLFLHFFQVQKSSE